MTAEVIATLPKVFKVAAAVVAPTTLLTALLFYFGLLEVQGIFRWLGVSYTVFDLGLQDYLIRSADGLFVPVVVGAAAVAVGVWALRIADAVIEGDRGARFVRVATPCLAVVGAAALVWAVIGLLDPSTFHEAPVLPGLLLVLGTLLVAYAARLLRKLHTPRPDVGPALIVIEWSAIFAIVSVGLFWAVGNYAVQVGITRGQQIAAALPNTPDAVVYSEKPLALTVPGVTMSRCTEPESAFTVRYTGLKLVLRSADQILLLPRDWTHETGTAVLLNRTDPIRLEFAAPGTAQVGGC
ncbi:hypothetical protein GCM10023215_64260 [Pseudonocardia yuanmonensis]|uniref:Uncharacterized protein n=1 Tax=Pseudonocardia yuanmonensis TaxID=1095914 RepID=A0ABP8XRX7_9PSEU